MTLRRASLRGWARVAVLVAVVAVVGVGLLLGWRWLTSSPSGSTFPTEVAGMPVMTVARAVDLLHSGNLDGRAVAVAGYFDEFTPSCPARVTYVGPLEGWCRFDVLAGSLGDAQLCQPMGPNGINCHEPTGTYLVPFFMSETSGAGASWLPGGATGLPAAMVLIGHAGDPRQWECTAAKQAECANAFVVDMIAWAQGRDLALTTAQASDLESGTPFTPRMGLKQVVGAIGLDNKVVSAAAFKAGDMASVDPRFAIAGDHVAWLVRSIAPAADAQEDGTRPETVWLVDDSTGRIIDTQPEHVDATFQPARLWVMATVHGLVCCDSNVLPFERVRAGDGTLVRDGTVSGSASGNEDSTTFGGGYGSPPLILPAGQYSIIAWLATYNRGISGPSSQECASEVTVAALDNVTLDAVFPAGQACSFAPAQSASP